MRHPPAAVLASLAAVLALSGPRAVAFGAGPVELPPPEFTLTADPVPLDVRPPRVEPPPPPAPLRFGVEDLGRPPLPEFQPGIQKPFPAVGDPGTFSCGLAFLGRGTGNLTRCGIARALRGELQRASEAFQESLTLEPAGPQAATGHLWIGELHLRAGRDDQAQVEYETALDRGLPRELAGGARLGLAWIALRRGEVAHADEAIRLAIESAPLPVLLGPARLVDGVVRLVDAVVRLLQGYPEAARAQCEQIEREGTPAELVTEVTFWHGAALVQLGDTQSAIPMLDRVRAGVRPAHPLYAASLAQRGWAQLVRGMAELARRDFLSAEAAHPSPALALHLDAGLARAYLALGQYAEARERTRRLARGQGEGPSVERLLLMTAAEALRRGAVTDAIETYRQLQGRPLEPVRRAQVAYRIAVAVEQLARETGNAARWEEADKEYRRLRDEGGDEGLVQRAAYWLALRALQAGRPAMALRDGEGLLQAGVVPEFRWRVLILSAVAASQAGDPNRAATLYRLAVAEGIPSERAAELRLALGWALLQDGNPEAALQQWRREAESDIASVRPAAYAAIARVALEQGHETEAAGALTALATLAPDSPLRFIIAADQGILRLRAGDIPAATLTLRPLLAERLPAHAAAAVRRALGIAAYRQRAYAEARNMFAQAAQLEPGDASNWLGAGLAALAESRLDDADRALARARLAADPTMATIAGYGLVLVRKDDPNEFERRAGTFVSAYPEHPYAGVLTARMVATALARGQSEQAYAWVKTLLMREPGSEHAEDALIRLSEAEYKRPALAFDVYREVAGQVRDRSARLRARLGMAQAALALGRPGDALAALATFIAEAPDDDPRVPGTELKRGELLVRAREWDAARAALEAARASGVLPVAPEAHIQLGDLSRSRADHDAAVEDYLGAAYLYPQTPWAALGLQGAAKSYLERKMSREARIVLEKLLKRPGVDPKITRWASDELTRLQPPPAAGSARPRPASTTRP